MSKEVARVDIAVGGDVPGSFGVIEAGSTIPAEYADRVAEWKERGLIGTEVADELEGSFDSARRLNGLKEVTQEEVDDFEERRVRLSQKAQAESDRKVEAAQAEPEPEPKPEAEPKAEPKPAPKPAAKK